MWVNQQKVTTLSSKTHYAAERGLRWRRAGVRQTLQERRAEVICRRGSDRYNCTRIRSGHPICDEGTGGTYDRSTTGSAVSITHEMTSFQRLSSSEYRLVVATGLICTLVDALTRPSTLNACLACFREPRGPSTNSVCFLVQWGWTYGFGSSGEWIRWGFVELNGRQ